MTDGQPLIQHRQVLTSLGSLALLSGCLGGPAESPTETTTTTGTNTSESESTGSGRAATTTSNCDRTEFCKGSGLVRVRVDSGSSGKVVLSPACRESDIGLSPGGTETPIRQTDAETCDTEPLVNDKMTYDGRIQDYECVMMRIGSGGEISLQRGIF